MSSVDNIKPRKGIIHDVSRSNLNKSKGLYKISLVLYVKNNVATGQRSNLNDIGAAQITAQEKSPSEMLRLKITFRINLDSLINVDHHWCHGRHGEFLRQVYCLATEQFFTRAWCTAQHFGKS